MTINDTKKKLEDQMKAAISEFEGLNTIVSYDVQVSENTTEDGMVEPIFIFSALSVSASGLSEDDNILLPIDTEIEKNGEVDEAKLNAAIEKFNASVKSIAERLKNAEDINSEIKVIGKEIDDELEKDAIAKLAKENEAIQKTYKTALVAGLGVLAVAVLCIVIKAIF